VTLSIFCEVALEALAVAAVGVFEHGQLALAVAAHDDEGVFERQGIEVDGRGQLVEPLFGEVALGCRVSITWPLIRKLPSASA
jgi:hypothetical protein